MNTHLVQLAIMAHLVPAMAKGCGDCWCIRNDSEQCPPPPQDYTSDKDLISGLMKQVPLNALQLNCDPYKDEKCTTTPPQDDMFGPEVVCGAIYQTQTCSTYKIQSFPSEAAALASGARILHKTRCGVCSTTQDLAVNLGLADMASGAYECAGITLKVSPEKGQKCFEEKLGFSAPCAKINVLDSVNTFTPGNCAEICGKLMKRNSSVPQVPFNGPPPECKLNDCLQCDEDLSGPHYQGFGGLSRRNAGLDAEIARPCDTVATGITHHEVCPRPGAASSYNPLVFAMHIAGVSGSSKPPPVQPTSHVRLIGAGFSKTGTSSLKIALKILGFKVYDFEEALPAGHNEVLTDVFLNKAGAFDKWYQVILDGGFDATLDNPLSLMYWEFFKKAPKDAKVLLSVREPEKWYRSYAETMEAFAPMVGWPFRFLVDLQTAGDKFQAMHDCPQNRTWFQPWYLPWVRTVTGITQKKDACVAGFIKHNKEVKAKVPADQLLVYDVKEGWEPLCKFLGVRVPSEPFPKANTASDMKVIAATTRVIAYMYPFIPLVMLVPLYFISRFVIASVHNKIVLEIALARSKKIKKL